MAEELMSFLNNFAAVYKTVLFYVAEMTVYTLEMVGISIIIIGSVKAIIQALKRMKRSGAPSIIIGLGRSLALALEFKMGAEIVNTVIIRDLKELGILAIVIALRAILALLIHWEIKTERRDEMDGEPQKTGANETPDKQ